MHYRTYDARLHPNIPRETFYGLDAEGISSPLVQSEVKPRKLSPIIKRSSFGQHQLTHAVNRASETISHPIDATSVGMTHGFLSCIEKVRAAKVPLPLFPWERLRRHEQPSAETPTQLEMIHDWLIDIVFPQSLIWEIDRISPGMGQKWYQYFKENVAPEYLNGPLRKVLSTLTESFGEGYVASYNELFPLLVIYKVVSPLIIADIETRSDQFLNSIYAIHSKIASDMRILSAGNLITNADVDIGRILDGSVTEISRNLAVCSLIGTAIGVNLGFLAGSSAKLGAVEGVRRALLSSGGTSILLIFYLKIMPNLLQSLAQVFGEASLKLNAIVSAEEKWERLEPNNQLSTEIMDAITQRNYATKEKNQAFEWLVRLKSLIAILLSGVLKGGSYAGLSILAFNVARVAETMLEQQMTYVSKVKNKKAAITRLTEQLESIHNSPFGKLTDSILKPWIEQREGSILNTDTITIVFSQIGIPPITTATGDTKSTIEFLEPVTLKSGEILMMNGKNTTGKTMVMQTLSGLRTGTLENTQVTINGHDIRELTALERRQTFVHIENTTHFNIKELIVTILLTYPNHNKLIRNVDRSRLKLWLTSNQHDPQIEQPIIDFITNQNQNLRFDDGWFEPNHKPSGFERMLATLLLYFSVEQPIALLIDEPEGPMTLDHQKELVAFIKENLKSYSGAIVVSPNKWFSNWVALENMTGIIDLNRTPSGLPLSHPEAANTSYIEDEVLEFRSRIDHGVALSPQEFALWFNATYSKAIRQRLTGEGDIALTYDQAMLARDLAKKDERFNIGVWYERLNEYLLSVCFPEWQKSLQSLDHNSCLHLIRTLINFYEVGSLASPELLRKGRDSLFNDITFQYLRTTALPFFLTKVFPLVQDAATLMMRSIDGQDMPKLNSNARELSSSIDLVATYQFLCTLVFKGLTLSTGRGVMALAMYRQSSMDFLPIPNLSYRIIDSAYFSQIIRSENLKEQLENPLVVYELITNPDRFIPQFSARLTTEFIPSAKTQAAVQEIRAQLESAHIVLPNGQPKYLWPILRGRSFIADALTTQIVRVMSYPN